MSNPPPYEIRLVVQSDPAGTSAAPAYQAHWQNAAGQQVTPPFALALPLTPDDLDELRWYLETYMQFPGVGDRQRAGAVEPQLRDWGRALFDAAFGSPQAQQIYDHMQQAGHQGQLCQITIGCDLPPVLQQPWELLYDARGPLAFRGVSVRRQLPASRNTLLPLFGSQLRVLLIVSRPEDVGFIDPRTSIRPLLEAVSALPAGLVQVDFCEPPTFARLGELIGQARRQNQPYHVVHFDGHGTYLPETGVGALAFENDRAELALVTGRQLGDQLSRVQVPLVLLEACRSADLSSYPPHDSVAPALLQAGVGSVVAFSHSVHVEAARLLVEQFYRELAAGRTVGQALDEGRARLQASPARWLAAGPDAETIDLVDWFIPQLYQVGPDPALLAGVAAPAGGAPALAPLDTSRLHDFPPAPRYRFQGRARELLRLERDFRQAPAVLLTGMGGMGKTALAREAAAWWLRTGRFADAVFVSLEGRPPAERVVQLVGLALEGESFSARPADEQWQWVVQAFHARKLLLVWDNAESVLPQFQAGLESELLRYSADELARLRRLYADLATNDPQGRLLITCRPAELDWPELKVRPLRGLARPDSQYVLRAVLERHAEARPPEYDRAELDALLDLLGDHPLSIELVGPHLLRRAPAAIRAEFGALLGEFASAAPDEERNRSLRASLAFSARHLSPPAQALLPWLAWFSGGMLETQLRAFANLTPEALAPLRAELVNTALVRLEAIEGFNSPYWQLHPTLPYAAAPEQVPDPQAAELRFVAVYRAVGNEARKALFGQNPAWGMALLRLEEANYRAALARAFRRGERQLGAYLANTLQHYLGRAGRLRERNLLVGFVQNQLAGHDRLDEAYCGSICDHAWTLFIQGQPNQAIEHLHGLLARIQQEGLDDGEDPAFQQALTLSYLGRIYDSAGRSDLALAPLQQAVAGFEQLGDDRQSNLSAALGDLANAYRGLGYYTKALKLAEQGLEIDRGRGYAHNVASSLIQIAQILAAQQRYREADERYHEAIAAARQAGDHELEAATLQHQGSLHDDQGNYDEAVVLYQQAMRLFQQAGNVFGEMQTNDLLGSVERQRGNLDAAQAWHEHSRELALQQNDQRQLGAVAQNLGILFQTRAEQERDQAQRTVWLRQALASMLESLRIALEQQDQLGAAASSSQLGKLYRMFGDLTQAEAHLQQALLIREATNHPRLYIVYNELALVAHARGDAATAAQWRIKREAKEAELVRRRATGGEMPALVAFEPLLLAIATAQGQPAQRAELEPRLAKMQANGWMLADAVHAIWAGERDLTMLAAGRDVQDTALIARILQFVAEPGAPPLLPDEE